MRTGVVRLQKDFISVKNLTSDFDLLCMFMREYDQRMNPFTQSASIDSFESTGLVLGFI